MILCHQDHATVSSHMKKVEMGRVHVSSGLYRKTTPSTIINEAIGSIGNARHMSLQEENSSPPTTTASLASSEAFQSSRLGLYPKAV